MGYVYYFYIGKTYGSECELTESACRDGKEVSVAYKGSCGKYFLIH